MATPNRAELSKSMYARQTPEPSSGNMGRYGVAAAQGGIGVFKAFATYRAGQARNMMAKYNAKIIEQEGRARDLAMKEQGRRLAEDQRGLKATQRMSVSGRGGLNSGTDLLTLADEAEKMQLDQLELMRQRDINTKKTRHEAYMTRWQGKQAKKASKWTAALGLTADLASAAGAVAGGA